MKFLITTFLLTAFNLSYSAEKPQVVSLIVTEKGFEPSTINVRPGTNIEMRITRKTNSTCARDIVIPSKNIKKELPLNKTMSVQTGKLEKGKIKFSCGMDMVTGVILVK